MALRIPIRTKLALTLAVPLAAVVAITGQQVAQSRADTALVERETAFANSVTGPDGVATALRTEQIDAITTVTGLRASVAHTTTDMADSIRQSDAARAALAAGLRSGAMAGGAIYGPVLEQLDQRLPALRARFRAARPPFDLDHQADAGLALFEGYQPLLALIEDANARLLDGVTRPELRAPVAVLDLVARSKGAYAAVLDHAVFAALTGTSGAGARHDRIVADLAEVRAVRRSLLRYEGTTPLGRQVSISVHDENMATLRRAVDDQLAGHPLAVSTILAVSDDADRVGALELTVVAERTLRQASARLVADAERAQREAGLRALAIVLAATLGAGIAATSVTRPLRSLTRQATAMAQGTLPGAVQQILSVPLGDDVAAPDPTPIVVRSRDEVQAVVTALNQVQDAAVQLAVEQAVLRRNTADSFVNLGRRTQNLINRQLELITELERDAADPAALDQLFRLDHLATRARRNAESLVVLAGVATPRTFTRPIALRDVVQACQGEVEDYQRVEVVLADEAHVAGSVAADLVHLLAELVENALSFSPGGSTVQVVGRMTRHGYVLAVVDEGVGMTDDELGVANARLAGAAGAMVAPSRYLGLYVVGHLAGRLGATVRLAESYTGGVVARVVLPQDRLVEPEPAPLELPAPAEPPAPTRAEPSPFLPEPLPSANVEPPIDPPPADLPPADLPTTGDGLRRRIPGGQANPAGRAGLSRRSRPAIPVPAGPAPDHTAALVAAFGAAPTPPTPIPPTPEDLP